jgi:hypothetical protein
MMQLVKDVTSVLGLITAGASVAALISKRLRSWVSGLVVRYSGAEEKENTIAEVKAMLERHIEEEKTFKDQVTECDNMMTEFVITQCRAMIKDKFYQYEHGRVLPLYEKKTLMNIKDLYIDRLHCNSFASLLLDEMDTWEVDYDKTHYGECSEQ